MSHMTFSPHRFSQARLAANMSQGDLAYSIRDLSHNNLKPDASSISDYENGRNVPSGDALPIIAEALGKSIEFFYSSGAEEEDDEEAALLGTPQDLYNALKAIVERTVREHTRGQVAA
jgi:transcriptional regulator with XRE-family HTH domain